ncbi:TMhelix containing protein [Vibrio phage 1.077.O._10N.261.45.A10]|nr:coil containing protein [Vibrio phage 1.070.O._10N.261.45.B2]AUR85602.1 TMhelix containing protein [Vibrio phage 1.077.O._10N.261.45.A10]
MAAVTTVVAVGAAVVGGVTAIKQSKIAKENARLQREQASLGQQAALQDQVSAEQQKLDNATRRTAVLAERERERRLSRVRADVIESREIRERINEARALQAEQVVAGRAAGFTGAASAIASDLGAAVGQARTEAAANNLLQQSQLRQQDILNNIVDVSTLPGFSLANTAVNAAGETFENGRQTGGIRPTPLPGKVPNTQNRKEFGKRRRN